MNENKVAVAVNCSVDRDGLTVPLLICWKDGRQFPIERVLHVCMEEDEEGERIRYSFLCFDICNAWLSGEDIKLLSQPEKQRLCGF